MWDQALSVEVGNVYIFVSLNDACPTVINNGLVLVMCHLYVSRITVISSTPLWTLEQCGRLLKKIAMKIP